MDNFKTCVFKILLFSTFLLSIALAIQSTAPNKNQNSDQAVTESQTKTNESESEVSSLLTNSSSSEELSRKEDEVPKETEVDVNMDVEYVSGEKNDKETHEEQVEVKGITSTKEKQEGQTEVDGITVTTVIKEKQEEQTEADEITVTKEKQAEVKGITATKETVTSQNVNQDSGENGVRKPAMTELPDEQHSINNSTTKALESKAVEHPAFSANISAVILATVCFSVALIGYVGLLVWRKFLEKRYGNSEMLIHEEDFYDVSDLRNFEI